MRRKVTVWMLAAAVALTGMSALDAAPEKKPQGEPDRVVVQHILIGFKRSVRNKVLERSRKEAKLLAASLFERARNGEEFDALVKEYTDDSYPGIYGVANFGVRTKSGERPRGGMVPLFGDEAFELEVGEIGLVKHHAANSPYGWHVIKRIE